MRIGLIGAGAMGRPIGHRLLGLGHEVTVFNRRASRVAPLVAAGAHVAPAPADAARGADAVLTVVSDAAALEAVLAGPSGAASAMAPGAILVDLGTVGPRAAIASRGAVPPGVAVLDAPMLGSLAEAAAGRLRLLVGGDRDDVERGRPILEMLGAVIHVGPAGAGAGAKLVANLALLGTLSVLAECAALADATGLHGDALRDTLAATPMAEQATKRRAALSGDPGPPRFALRHAHKDAELAVETLVGAGREAPVTRATLDRLAAALAAGLGDEDYTTILTPACWRT